MILIRRGNEDVYDCEERYLTLDILLFTNLGSSYYAIYYLTEARSVGKHFRLSLIRHFVFKTNSSNISHSWSTLSIHARHRGLVKGKRNRL